MKTINVSIIGVTGFTGAELLRVLIAHPHVRLKHLTSRQHERTSLGQIYPRLSHIDDLYVSNTDYATVAKDSDVVFLCLPHMASQSVIDQFMGHCKVIDMSADFRLDTAQDFKTYYDVDHTRPDLLDGTFKYGAPSFNRDVLKGADYVANPGCNALLVQLMLAPFAGQIDTADVFLLTGTSGGGAAPRDPMDHPVLTHNVRSYQVNRHRHTPEILRTAKMSEEQFNFIPTVGPFLRGIFATAFVRMLGNAGSLGMYKDDPFIRTVDKVALSNIVSTQYADVSITQGQDNVVIVQGALDNLLMGAAGTAVQNMNLMCGFNETEGLRFTSASYP